MEYGVSGDLTIVYTKPYSIYLKRSIGLVEELIHEHTASFTPAQPNSWNAGLPFYFEDKARGPLIPGSLLA